jgi:hypothetical protein
MLFLGTHSGSSGVDESLKPHDMSTVTLTLLRAKTYRLKDKDYKTVSNENYGALLSLWVCQETGIGTLRLKSTDVNALSRRRSEIRVSA